VDEGGRDGSDEGGEALEDETEAVGGRIEEGGGDLIGEQEGGG